MLKVFAMGFQQFSGSKVDTISKPGFLIGLLITLGTYSLLTIPVSAQITAGGDKTSVNTNGNVTDITGGTRSGNNLFHSFDKFNLPTISGSSSVANFVQPDAAVKNILGRVTGGTFSSIDGKIQVTGGNANLYLMNPAGIVFGQNASLDVNGAFTATTARAIGFGNGNWFNAVGANNYDSLTGNPQGLAFTNTPGSILNAATLKNNQPKQDITLVGGTVVSTGDIITQGGRISIATVQGGKYVQIKSDGSILSLNLPTDAKNINSEATNLVPTSLAALLTNSGIADSNLKVNIGANGVVNLVSPKTGDIITKTLSSSGTQQVSETDKPNVSLNTQSGDIIVNAIDTSSNFFGDVSFGGNVTVNAGGLFRATGTINPIDSNPIDPINNSIFTGGNKDIVNSTATESLYGGKINITHQGNSFVIGGKTQIIYNSSGGSSLSLKISTPLVNPFSFPEGASGTRAGIVTRNTNGSFGVVFKDGVFIDQTGSTASGFGITSVPPGSSGQAASLDTQVSRPKPKDDCIQVSTTVAANPSAGQTRSIRSNTTSTNTCPSNVDNGKILQVSNRSQ